MGLDPPPPGMPESALMTRREEPIEDASAPPLDLEQNRRPKRAHAKPDRFDFRRDGLNDTALKKKSTSKK